MYSVNEIFTSVQGEGLLAGVPATFIRLQGCTVGCPWCDTKYTWKAGGTKMTVADIVAQVHSTHVVITGGEPTIYNLDELIEGLKPDHFVQLETSGQNELKGKLAPDWMTWSPKENLFFSAPKSIQLAADEVKWVVDDNLPYSVVMSLWQNYQEPRPVFVFMPEGTPPKQPLIEKTLRWLAEAPIDQPHMWRFGDRLQWRLGVR